MGLECNIKVDLGAGGRVAQTLPVGRDGIPHMLHTNVVPMSWEGCREVRKGSGSEDKVNKAAAVAHDHRETRDATNPENTKHW